VLGEQISIPIHVSKNDLLGEDVVDSEPIQIVMDSHREVQNPDVFLDADLALFKSFHYWIQGNVTESE
jgi:hypothetical protein